MNIHGQPDLHDTLELLSRCDLPTADVNSQLLEHFLGVRSGPQLVGCIGLEKFGRRGLLRSLAVDPTARGTGLGNKLVAALEQQAQEDGIETLYLLTTDADGYFLHHGYAVLPREETPDDIRTTRQFSSLCPGSATVMVKTLVK